MASSERNGFRRILQIHLLVGAAILLPATWGVAQVAPQMVKGPVVGSELRALVGNPAPQIGAGTDLGEIPQSMPIHRLQLLLARSPEQEAAVRQLIDQQQDRSSASFHRWLTPTEFGRRFGASDEDIAALTGWLAGLGFTGIKVNAARTRVEFDGTAGLVQGAFHTSLHSYEVNGEGHIANVSSPSIPAALAALVAGFASLDNLPHAPVAGAMGVFRRDNASGVIAPVPMPASTHPELTINSAKTYYAVTPWDFATIYDVLPLWSAPTPIDGTGQTIAVVGDTDFNAADFIAFRTLFDLPLGNTSVATGTQYLSIIYNGPNPGVRSDEAQADIDTQWASAVAKGAVVDYVASADTEVSHGIDLSAAYIVDNNLAAVLTDSFNKCELTLGTSGNAFYSSLWQQAAAQGITVVAASGDSGSSACDLDTGPPATTGLAVNGIASTPYDVSVGGTDFYTPSGRAAFFGTNNPVTQASAVGYIPETTWNETCTNASLSASAPFTGMTQEQVCNASLAQTEGLLQVSGSGGGSSGCTTSSGTRASCGGGYAKPSWQVGNGVPADGVRHLPDVALFASKGSDSSFYVVCQQDLNADGKACNVSSPYADFAAYGGTGVTAPAFAGVMALIAQSTGERVGNPNYALYNLAAQQTAAGTACNATGTLNAACIFHDVTTGTNAMPCVASSANCITTSSGSNYGVLSAGNAAVGYDQTTGLGSVDVANLARQWATASFSATTAVLTLTPSSLAHGSPVSASVTVSGGTGTPTGNVAILAATANGAVGSGSLTGGVYSTSIKDLPGGSYGVQAHYGGDQTHAAADSNYVSVTVTPENSTTNLQALEINPLTNVATAGVASAPYGTVFYIRADVAGLSGQGTATGNVLINDNGTAITSGTFRLNSSGYTEAQVNSLLPGTHLFTASYTGDASFNPSTANSTGVTITLAPTNLALTSSVSTLAADSTVTLTATVNTQGYGYYTPSGLVSFYAGSTLLGQTTLVPGKNSVTFADLSIASFTLAGAALPQGVDTITATYGGDTIYLGSVAAPLSVTVTAPTLAATVTTVTATPQFVNPSGTILFSASVTPGTPVPTGTVQFLVDNQNIGAPVPLLGGTAQLSETILSLEQLLIPVQTLLSGGGHTLTAVYSGSTTRSSSVSAPSAFSVVIPTVSSVPVFTLNPANPVQGTFVSVQVTISPNSPVATGAVQLVLDGGLYGSTLPLTGGQTSLPLNTATLQAGPHVVSVFYTGDTTYKAAYAPNQTMTVIAEGAIASTVTLSNVPSLVQTGNPLLFDVDIAPSSPTPTGILQLIVDGGTPGRPIGLTGSHNVVTLSTAGLALGSHTLAAFYSGDATYSFSTSAATGFAVVPVGVIPPGTFSLSPSSIATISDHFGFFPPSLTFTATPGTNFNANVSFSCSGMPAQTSCLFTPATVALSTAPLQTVLTFDLSSIIARSEPPSHPWAPISGALAMAGLMLCILPRRRRRTAGLFLCLVFGTLTMASGCGSGFHNDHAGEGTYSVIVTATGGGVTQNATVTLTVQ